MRHGRMDRRIAIRRVTVTQDAYGQATRGETALATVFASRIELRPGDTFVGGADMTTNSVVWRIHWRSDVSERDIVSHGSERFEITALREVGRRAGLELVCERTGANV